MVIKLDIHKTYEGGIEVSSSYYGKIMVQTKMNFFDYAMIFCQLLEVLGKETHCLFTISYYEVKALALSSTILTLRETLKAQLF